MSEKTVEKGTRKRTKLLTSAVILVVVLGIGAYAYLTMQGATPKQHLIISSTTSLYETGFLDVVKSAFEKENPSINVSFLSQGTGLAIQTAMRGDADMIFVHDAAAELQFLRGGYGVNRKVVAYNFFVIVGPQEDPAGVKGLSPTDAFKKIKEAGEKKNALWVSRGDNSGTHSKEKNIWKSIGFNATILRNNDWYLEAGAGMTATLNLANQKRAYTLTDLGSYLMNYNKKNIDLEILVQPGKSTLNVYSVIANNPRKTEVAKSNFNASMKFINFVISDKGQALFDDYGQQQYGKPLFAPYVNLLKKGNDTTLIQWIVQAAYFNGTECPSQYRYQEGDLYSPEKAPNPPAAALQQPSSNPPTKLQVFVASSLTNAVKKYQATFEKENNVKLNFTTGGSDSLYQQIVSGSATDVYMSADFKWTNMLKTAKLLLNNEYKNFTTNNIIAILAANNPKSITSLDELTLPNTGVAVAKLSVPVGKATDTTLAKIQSTWGNRSDARYKGAEWEHFKDKVLLNIISYEPTVSNVVNEVLTGLCDVGFAYTTDVKSQGSNLTYVQIPSEVNTKTNGMAVMKNTANKDLAAKYMAFWLSDEGKKLLADFGFGTPS
jgi:tungstate transport system substrate-binding protein